MLTIYVTPTIIRSIVNINLLVGVTIMLVNAELEKKISVLKKESFVRKDGRRFYQYHTVLDGIGYRGDVQFAQVVWNLYFPDDKIVYGDNCVIHHKDENHKNDCITNLKKLTRSEHMKLHHSSKNSHNYGKFGKDHNRGGAVFSASHKNRISKALKGRVFTEETKKKMSDAKQGSKNNRYGTKHSEETKQKIRLAALGRKVSEETKKKMSIAATIHHATLEGVNAT
jgi:hypothetical protein